MLTLDVLCLGRSWVKHLSRRTVYLDTCLCFYSNVLQLPFLFFFGSFLLLFVYFVWVSTSFSVLLLTKTYIMLSVSSSGSVLFYDVLSNIFLMICLSKPLISIVFTHLLSTCLKWIVTTNKNKNGKQALGPRRHWVVEVERYSLSLCAEWKNIDKL